MPIKATCPTCTKSYMLTDAQAGKRVRCKHCDDVFQVPATSAPDVALVEPIDVPPPRPAPPPLKTAPAAEDIYSLSPADPPPLPARRPPSGPPRRPQPRPDSGYRVAQPPSSILLPIVLLGSGAALALLLLVCGIFAMSGSSKDREEPRAQGNGPDAPRPDKDRPRDDNQPRDNQPRDNQPRDNQPRDQVRDVAPRDKDRPRDDKPPEDLFAEAKNLDEALAFLKHANVMRRRMGALWFIRAPVDEGRRAEAARALEPLVRDQDNQLANNAATALVRWATRDQVPTLIAIVQKGDQNSTDAMNMLAKLKDPRGLPVLMTRFKVPGQTPFAANALRTWGAEAEPEVLKLMHDPNVGIRVQAQSLLAEYKTKEETLLAQTIADLGSADTETKRDAVGWLTTRPKVIDEKRSEVAKALSPVLLKADALSRGTVLGAVDKWLSKESVPALLQLLQDPKVSLERHRVIALLGKTKDERAAKPLADLLDKPLSPDTFSVRQAIKEMGSVAEPAVKAKLTNANALVRREAVNVLAEIGTRDSVGDLKRLSTADLDPLVKITAKTAVQRIEAREKK